MKQFILRLSKLTFVTTSQFVPDAPVRLTLTTKVDFNALAVSIA
jgi:hypothetical protein